MQIAAGQARTVSAPPVAAPRCPATTGQVGPTSRRSELLPRPRTSFPALARGSETPRCVPRRLGGGRRLGKAWRAQGAARTWRTSPARRWPRELRGSARSRGVLSRAKQRQQRQPLPPLKPSPGMRLPLVVGWGAPVPVTDSAGAFWLTLVSLSGVVSKNRNESCRGWRERREARQVLLRCCFFTFKNVQTSAARACESRSAGCLLQEKFVFLCSGGLPTILAPLTFTFLDLSSCLDRVFCFQIWGCFWLAAWMWKW